MNDAAPALLEPARPDDPARIERQLAMLDALAAAGVQVAREVGRQAEEQQTPAAELSLAYSRVSRALRLVFLLQDQLIEARDTRQARIRKALEDAEGGVAEVRKARVERIVERLAVQAHPHDEEQVDRLLRETGERLDDTDLYGDLLERPVSEIVARLCQDLGLAPDWTALAQELWAKDEIASGEVGEPLKSLSAASPAGGGGGPRSGGEGTGDASTGGEGIAPQPPEASLLDGFP